MPGSAVNLFLATTAFSISFAFWGLIAGLSPLLKVELRLSATDAGLMLAIPVLLGSVGRIPMGGLTDRLGGRLVFSILLMFAVIPAAALSLNHSYHSLLFWGFWLGLAGTSFAIGIPFVSQWFPPEKQGLALGIYGAGNIGQSIAVFFGPYFAYRIGIPPTFALFGAASLAWGLVFSVWARNAQVSRRPVTIKENVRVLCTEPLSWLLSLFYFLTFGGFVALSIYLPILLREFFSLEPVDAGARTAGFIILATACRPIGGWLSDRFGGANVLLFVFEALALFPVLMVLPSIYPFTVGALGSAALLGLGNGAVFKLVPQHFPGRVGAVTGLVGAAGGIGGFFPPIVLGILKDVTGNYVLGFVFLGAFSLGCCWMLRWVFVRLAER
ncbi:MAG: NarK/NasA family nitrate transporter [Armatimonadetes bacterium]|nr:NarK/NasA family nitrate transporter [Armatimonadota bacterium]